MEGIDEKIGVVIKKCDFEVNTMFIQPAVKVFLVDSQNGESLMGSQDNLATKPFNAFRERSKMPYWDEILTINRNFKEICENKSTRLLLLFEITDIVKPSTGENNTIRVAWAFLKPVGFNGNLNIERELRLQLNKIRKRCSSVSHHTCPVFHLYSAHEKKKYPGSLYVTLKGVIPVETNTIRPATSKINTEPQRSSMSDLVSSTPEIIIPTLELVKWSRLPTQSCKIVNSKVANIPICRRGASSVCFSHSGFQLACASFAHILIVDAQTSKIVSKVTGHTGLVYEVSWSGDDSLLLSVSADCSAVIWNVKPLSKSPLCALAHPSFVYAGKWLKSGYRLVTGGKDSLIRFWGMVEDKFELIQQVGGHGGFITSLETHGEVMFSGDSSGSIRLWSLEGNKWVYVRKFSIKELTGAILDTVILHPGQRRILVTARGRGSFMVDASSGIVITSYKTSSPMTTRCISCLSPCGTLLFEFGRTNSVNVWEFDTGKLVATYENIFLDLGGTQAELSGCIAYHPHEHMAAFAILGFNYPVIIAKYDREADQSVKLGLTVHAPTSSKVGKSDGQTSTSAPSTSGNPSLMPVGSSTEEKLAAIVRNIDKVLAAKRLMLGKLSHGNVPRD